MKLTDTVLIAFPHLGPLLGWTCPTSLLLDTVGLAENRRNPRSFAAPFVRRGEANVGACCGRAPFGLDFPLVSATRRCPAKKIWVKTRFQRGDAYPRGLRKSPTGRKNTFQNPGQ